MASSNPELARRICLAHHNPDLMAGSARPDMKVPCQSHRMEANRLWYLFEDQNLGQPTLDALLGYAADHYRPVRSAKATIGT